MSAVRALDRTIAVLGLALLSPVMLVIGATVRVTSRGPALYRATRMGRGGVPFTLYKFRSMRVTPRGSGPRVTATGDPRITRVGRFLRRTKLDELPQLVNVARGEMGLVGARPEDPDLVDLEDARWQELLRWPPGITGPASLAFRDEEAVLAEHLTLGATLEDAYRSVAAEKMAIDLAYLRTRTLGTDLKTIWRTFSAVLTPARGNR